MEIHTARRIPIPAKIAFAGGNGYTKTVCIAAQNEELTYYTNTLSKNCAGRNGIQDVDGLLEPCHYFALIASIFSKCFCLVLEHCNDRVGGVTTFEP